MHFFGAVRADVVRLHMVVPDSDPGAINKFSVLCYSCNANCNVLVLKRKNWRLTGGFSLSLLKKCGF